MRDTVDCWHLLVEQQFGIAVELYIGSCIILRTISTRKILLNTAGFLFLLCLNINETMSLNKT